MDESGSDFKVEGHTDVHDANVNAGMTRQYIDAGATAQEVQDHLRSHCGWIGAYPLRRHSMIGSESKDGSPWDRRFHFTRDHDVERGQFLEPAQAPDWFRQSIEALLRLCQETRVGLLNPI